MEKYDEYLEERFKQALQIIDKFTFVNTNIKEKLFLSHYTDLNGLLGILNLKSLWASNAFFLNDSSEVEYGLNLSHDLFNDFYKSIKNIRVKKDLESFYDNYSGFVPSSNLFLVSFCEDGDLLSLWRGYTSNCEGVSLSFNLPVLRTLPQVNLYKVIYNKNEQLIIIDELLKLLKDLMEHYEKIKSYGFLHYLGLWIKTFTSTLLTFKDNSFSEEKEWRLIHNHDSVEKTKIIEYRIKNNYILPYIKIENLNLTNLISGIVIGPSSNNSILSKSIEYFLSKKKYEHIQITHSKIPFRK
jgi:hypothetical protein